MTAFALYIILSYSIILPAIAGAVRFNSIAPGFYPFIILLWIGLFNETLSLVMVYTVGTNLVNDNIYVLLEYGLLLLQFCLWNKSLKKTCLWLAGIGCLVWIADNLVINTIRSNTSFFRLFYFLVIFFLSLIQVSRIVNAGSHCIFKNPAFLVCTAFLVYYSCRAFMEMVNFFLIDQDNLFNTKVFMVSNVANLFSYIIYTIAILCIPGKHEFITQ